MATKPAYKLAGVMGWPVAHSRSPLIHNHWIAQYGLSGAYVLLPVEPAKLQTAIRALAALGFAGCNLTIPHKVDVMQWLDVIESSAKRIGAVNTVVVEADGALTGRNTDAFGFIESLHQEHPDWRGDAGPACVIGAGGAARAVLCALLDDGVPQVRLCNRSSGKAHELAQEFGPRVLSVEWQERHEALRGINLLVNTTNQGMHGQEALDLQLEALPCAAVVSDIIYVPLQTPLLAAASARGNRTSHGLGMLLHQARPAFEAWFGVHPQVTPDLWEKVMSSL
jgi:shikimate dehydrogenase